MTEQPEALRLADFLDDLDVRTPYSIMNCVSAAAELRRLHAVNAKLLEALEEAADDIESWGAYASGYFQTKHDLLGAVNKARAAIAAAKEQA
jgi:arginine utilization protein RocB